ncbi:MAG: hypothetical protein M3Z37_03295 [Candidatus Eremiobacteraeota bacterium]|nr:hypothetical protein [Candidatus Eremiobacteraeota bacterium]
MKRSPALIPAFFGVLLILTVGVSSLADPVLPRYHVDAAGFHISAPASHPYSDTVEETREESMVRILVVSGLLLAILQNIHGRRKAKAEQHRPPPPCNCASAYPSPVPVYSPTPTPVRTANPLPVPAAS